MEIEEQDTFYPKSQKDWRKWLQKNHEKKQFVWLVSYKKQSNLQTITWSQAVDEALCFGWIDSVRKTFSPDTFIQFFSQRKPNSTWSKINKQKIAHLIVTKQMTQAGLACIERAKQNGSWTILDEVEELIIPNDLEAVFKIHPGSEAFFISQSKSTKKALLQWLVLAKQPTTRQKRINKIAELAAKNLKPKPFN